LSIKGFSVNGVVQRYDYTALDNLPQGQGVSDDLKAALLQLAQKVAYIDDQGQTYYDDLYDALYPERTLLSITANFQQGQAVVYNTDSLDSLKQYLTVTATYDDASTETVPSSAYTLSGTLTTGTSVITVTYEGKTDAFNVVVTAAPIALTVTNNLTGCTTSNSATSVLQNSSYTAVITASSGYTLVGATVSITMGGNDITTSAYSGGIITINSVTGALVISVAAAAVVLSSISAVYTQSGTVYGTDTLDSLKADLVVTAHYSDSSTQTVPAADYTLSGTLTDGSSTITVSYGGKTTTFDVVVTWIPSAYQEVEYLESTGTQYITTDLLSQLPMSMECRVAPTVENSGQFAGSGVSSDGNTRFFLGGVVVANTGSSINYFAVRASDSSSGYTPGDEQWTGGNWVKALPELVINDIYTVVSGIETDGTQHIQVDDFAESRLTKKIPTVGYPFYFMYSSNITTPSNIRIYYAKLFTGSTLLFYGIPCYRKSDNAGGLYDLVSDKFYGNSGTGSFVLGQDVVRG
jgi:hypothetical protein